MKFEYYFSDYQSEPYEYDIPLGKYLEEMPRDKFLKVFFDLWDNHMSEEDKEELKRLGEITSDNIRAEIEKLADEDRYFLVQYFDDYEDDLDDAFVRELEDEFETDAYNEYSEQQEGPYYPSRAEVDSFDMGYGSVPRIGESRQKPFLKKDAGNVEYNAQVFNAANGNSLAENLEEISYEIFAGADKEDAFMDYPKEVVDTEDEAYACFEKLSKQFAYVEIEKKVEDNGITVSVETIKTTSQDKLEEGTWSLPDSTDKAKYIGQLMKQPIDAETAEDKLYKVLGDDSLYDYIDDASNEQDVRYEIYLYLKDFVGTAKPDENGITQEILDELQSVVDSFENTNNNLLQEDRMNMTLQKLADSIRVTGPSHLGARMPEFNEYAINESRIPHNMRYKNYHTEVFVFGGINEIALTWETQEPFTSKDADVLINEIERAIGCLIDRYDYHEPFTVVVEVIARDGKDEGYAVVDLSFNQNELTEKLHLNEGYENRCERCNARLSDNGECPACDHGEEDLGESLTESFDAKSAMIEMNRLFNDFIQSEEDLKDAYQSRVTIGDTIQEVIISNLYYGQWTDFFSLKYNVKTDEWRSIARNFDSNKIYLNERGMGWHSMIDFIQSAALSWLEAFGFDYNKLYSLGEDSLTESTKKSRSNKKWDDFNNSPFKLGKEVKAEVVMGKYKGLKGTAVTKCSDMDSPESSPYIRFKFDEPAEDGKHFAEFPQLKYVKPLNEGLSNIYTLVYYDNDAGRNRRPETPRDIKKGWHEVQLRADDDLDACEEAFRRVYGYDAEEYFDKEPNIDDFVEYFETTDWSDGSKILISLFNGDNTIYDSGYTKQSWAKEFLDENEDIDMDESKYVLNEADDDRVSATIPADLLNNPDAVDFKSYIGRRSADARAERARQEKEARMAERAAHYKDVLDHARELMETDNADEAIEVLFEALVPPSGQADTVAGELTRAMMRILYRDYNDGDLFYEGYGIETCGSSVAYIIDVIGDHLIDTFEGIALRQLQDDSYTQALNEVTKAVVNAIISNNEYITTDNEEDSRSKKWEDDYEDRFKDDWEPKYEYSFEVADKIHEHILEGNITMQDVVSRMEDNLMYQSGFDGVEIYSDGMSLTIENLTKEALEELEHWDTDADQYWSDYIDELNDEFGDPDDYDEDDDYEDEDEDEDTFMAESAFNGGQAEGGFIDTGKRAGGAKKVWKDELEGKKTKSLQAKDLKPGMITSIGKIQKVTDIGWMYGKRSVEVSYGGIGAQGSHASDVVAADKTYEVLDESLDSDNAVYYGNGEIVPEDSVDMDKALDFQYGTDRNPDNSTFTREEKQKAINYWEKKHLYD